ncbi:MAG: choice-of-anchor U domain-containing protein, partial [Aquificaceae bacterium]
GGVSYGIEPAGNPAGGLSLKQNRFATTLTISYSKPLNPRAKVFACTSGGCIDITSLVTIDTNRNSITVRVEDGGIMDEDGQINGEIKTKDFVYAVVPEEYRKGGGCAMGGGADYGFLSLLLIPLLALLRRLGFKALLTAVFFSLPAFASMEQVQKHMKEGEYEEALSVLDEVIKERGLSEERVLLKSYILLKLGQLKESASFVEESIKFIPSDRLRLRLAYLYGITGDFVKGWNALREVKKKDQDYHFVEGFLYLKEGNLTRAKFSLSRVTPSSENYQEAQLYLAQVHLAEGDYHLFSKAVGRIGKDSEFDRHHKGYGKEL